jgi:hypothetical protein
MMCTIDQSVQSIDPNGFTCFSFVRKIHAVNHMQDCAVDIPENDLANQCIYFAVADNHRHIFDSLYNIFRNILHHLCL